MQTIYEPRGKAREYAALAANLYRGCTHGCTYCYVPPILRMDRPAFAACGTPRPNVIRNLEKDCRDLAARRDTFPGGQIPSVLLSFTCDTYQHADTEHRLTRQAIEAFNRFEIPYTILTKGGRRSLADLDIWRPDLGTYATTLVFTDERCRAKYEPGAAPTLERINCLKEVHAKGIRTWVSLEPVFSAAQTLEIVRLSHQWTDLYKVGVLNYLDEAKAIDWSDFAHQIVTNLNRFGKAYYIKQDLRKHLPTGAPAQVAAGA